MEGYAEGYGEYLSGTEEDLDDEGVKYMQAQNRKRFRSMRKNLHVQYDDIIPAESIDEFMNAIIRRVNAEIEGKKQKGNRDDDIG